ncbi:hypothetical protein BDQ12DRAFT_681073 [Crucibulum laeve]|uniref:Uncharacterized protein n=1 Tax=Crucibulum laeve TaxID=68775 RepID=A0A5C3M383_9AGAR|nr:hypothetical protein BDQ12DRAFT_681073 [Crucibulum laeve]
MVHSLNCFPPEILPIKPMTRGVLEKTRAPILTENIHCRKKNFFPILCLLNGLLAFIYSSTLGRLL